MEPSHDKKRVLVVGAGKVGHAVAERLQRDGCAVVGFADDDSRAARTDGFPILGNRDAVVDLVREHHVDEVVVAYAPTWQEMLVDDLQAGLPSVQVDVVPSHYESLLRTPRVNSLGDVAVVHITEPQGRVWDGLKRGMDIAGAIVGITVSAPVFVVAAALVRLASPGPVIFVQDRVGRGGRVFRLYKLRTMRMDAEEQTGPVFSSGSGDPRVTRIGRYLRACRADEIPQLWNVLRGDMSLVGPRPERPCFVEQFQRIAPLYARRHEVRPGITGLAQVLAGYRTDARDKLRFDLIYVAHRSLWLDLKILFKTLLVVMRSEGS